MARICHPADERVRTASSAPALLIGRPSNAPVASEVDVTQATSPASVTCMGPALLGTDAANRMSDGR